MKRSNQFLQGLRGEMLIVLTRKPKPKNCSQIVKISGCTYAYGVKMLHELEDEGYIISKVEGRERQPSLTPMGLAAAETIIKYKINLEKAEALYT